MSFDQQVNKDISLPDNTLTENLQAVELQKAIAINQILKKKEIDQVDLIAYSEGSINGLIERI